MVFNEDCGLAMHQLRIVYIMTTAHLFTGKPRDPVAIDGMLTLCTCSCEQTSRIFMTHI